MNRPKVDTVNPGDADHETVNNMAAILEQALWMNFPPDDRAFEAALSACCMVGGSAIGRRLAMKGDADLDEAAVEAAFEAMKKNCVEGAKIGWKAALEGMALTAKMEGKVQ